MAQLLISHPVEGDLLIELSGKEITIGRTPDNTIVIPEGSVSSHHARLTRGEDGAYRLVDLESTNHIWNDGEAIAEIELQDEVCALRIGNVPCVFLPAPPPPPAPAPPKPDPKTLAELAAAKKRIDELSAAAAGLGEELKKIRAAHDAAQAEAARLAGELADARQKLAAAARERDAEKAGGDRARAELAEARAQVEAHAAAWEKERRELAAGTRAKEEEFLALAKERDALRAESERALKRWEALAAHLRRMREAEQELSRMLAETGVPLPAPASAAESANGTHHTSAAVPPAPAEPAPASLAAAALPPQRPAASAVQPAKNAPASGAEDSPPAELSEDVFAALRNMRACTNKLTASLRDSGALTGLFGSARELARHTARPRSLAGIHSLAAALEALVDNLCKRPEELGVGMLHTVGRATDTLRLLLEQESGVPAVDFSASCICVLSDAVGTAGMVQRALGAAGLDAEISHFTLDEIELLEDEPCDVAVLDCGPREKGWLEFGTLIRQAQRHKRLPLVVLTQSAPESFSGSLSGREDFARQPVHPEEFAVKIMTAILKRRADQHATQASKPRLA